MTNSERSRTGWTHGTSRGSVLPRIAALFLTLAFAGLPACSKQEDVGANETSNEVQDVAAEAKAEIREETRDAKQEISEQAREARDQINEVAADEG